MEKNILVFLDSLKCERKIDAKIENVKLMTQDSQIAEIIDWVDNMDFIGVKKLFEQRDLNVARNLFFGVDKLFDYYDSEVFELFGSEHFGKENFYDFLTLRDYVCDSHESNYSDIDDKLIDVFRYFGEEELADKLFIFPCPLSRAIIKANYKVLHIIHTVPKFSLEIHAHS